MSWLTDFVRPKLQALIRRKDIPDNLWTNCNACNQMLFQRDFQANQYVCHHCNNHMRMPVSARIESLMDPGFILHPLPKVVADPLKFRDSKKYADRIRDYRQKTQLDDAIVVASGHIMDQPIVIAAFAFDFMGGSMGMAVGESLLMASDIAIRNKAALLAIPASGGARMQEGILSLMQMPRSTIAVERVKEARLPYLTLLTDPTTGGVSASFAMLGDITFAEPGSTIGFAGARVIEETIRQKLPEGFQKAEYLLEHGMVDHVIHRHKAKETIGHVIKMLLKHKVAA